MNHLVDLVRDRADTAPDRVPHVFLCEGKADGGRLTCVELDRRARALAVRLREQGVAPGDRVLILYGQGLEFVVSFFGCLYAGAVAVPMPPLRRGRSLGRLAEILGDARPAAILAPPVGANLDSSDDWPALPWVEVETTPDSLADLWRPPALKGSSLALLQYTSGSTTAPRGVRVTHANVLHNQVVLQQAMDLNPDTRGVSWLPPHHDMGLMSAVIMPVFTGAVVALMSPLGFVQQPVTWLEAVTRFRATHSGGPTFAFDLCLRRIKKSDLDRLRLDSWQVAFVGAEPVRPETLEQFAAAFAPAGFRRRSFFPCYGLAESVLYVAGTADRGGPKVLRVDGPALEQNRVVLAPHGEPGALVGRIANPSYGEPGALATGGIRELVGCGHGTPGHQVLVVDPSTCRPCPDGRVGEIWLAGPSVADGYWGRPEESHLVFGATLADTGEGPFLRTGDLGFWQGGELFITGRIKDLIIIRGRNHYPQDIERTVQQCHTALPANASAAFSVETEGEERLVIVLELPREARAWRREDVVLSIRQAVAEHHELTVHTVVLLRPASLPKTTSGKIQRHQCRQRFLAGTLSCWDLEETCES